jgi:predicted TPR repeat methyltransferase
MEGKATTTTNYRESHLQPEKGQSYHATFSDYPYRNMVWQFEKCVLDRIVTLFYKDSEIHYCDFACGTGRILSHLENRTKSAVGVDLSPSMLEVARKNSRNAEIVEADLTRSDVLGDRKFNLITAFRFFPNAEAGLRLEAMQVLSRHLDDNGYLVFNNHKNTGSTRNRLARLFGHRSYKGMSMAEVKALLAENHLRVVKIYPLCVFPSSDKRSWLPLFLLRPIEALLSKCRPFRNLGENLIFVCRRSVNRCHEKE